MLKILSRITINPQSLCTAFNIKFIHLTNCDHLFWEKDKRGGYETKSRVSKVELVRSGLKELKAEINLWREEVKEHFYADPVFTYRPGQS